MFFTAEVNRGWHCVLSFLFHAVPKRNSTNFSRVKVKQSSKDLNSWNGPKRYLFFESWALTSLLKHLICSLHVIQLEWISVLFLSSVCLYTEWSLVEWVTFEVHSVDEHKNHIMWNTFQEVGDVAIGGVIHPMIDLLQRGQGNRLWLVPEEEKRHFYFHCNKTDNKTEIISCYRCQKCFLIWCHIISSFALVIITTAARGAATWL